MSQPLPPQFRPDTTGGSLLHRLARARAADGTPVRLPKIYLLAVMLTYVPLLIAAALGSSSLWEPAPGLRLTFLRDLNIAFTFLVSFPTLLLLLVTDDRLLRVSLKEVQEDEIIALKASDAEELNATWYRIFRIVNLLCQTVGLLVALGLAWLTCRVYLAATAGFWIARGGRLEQPVGSVYIACIVALYTVILLYVARSLTVSWLLWRVVRRATVRLLPFHPDGSGGLSCVGRLGLRNQVTLSVLGLNIAILALVSLRMLSPGPSVYALIFAAAAVYCILGPILFLGPLLPFRSGMLRTKREWARDAVAVLRGDIDRLRGKVRRGEFEAADEAILDRLRKLGNVVDELPVWPFDGRTLRRFATAYAIPLAVPIIDLVLLGLVRWLSP